jgi:hypothetical protein
MTRRRWKAWEVGLMLERYPREGSAAMKCCLARSVDAITSEARRLGLPSPGRYQRQALSHARSNASVNVHFFETLTPTVAFVLGYIWATGRIKMSPRHVLRLRCPSAKENALLAVRGLLGSRHHVQRRGGHTVCDVCSSWLVQTLVRKYGPPPGAADPDPPLPRLSAEYLPHLARGLLVGGGQVEESRLTWNGTERVTRELEDLIRAATGVAAPEKRRAGKLHRISWSAPQDVQILTAWLGLDRPSSPPDPP